MPTSNSTKPVYSVALERGELGYTVSFYKNKALIGKDTNLMFAQVGNKVVEFFQQKVVNNG